MKAKQTEGDAPIRRITIDEKLSDNLIRALASPLAPGVEEFGDDTKDWGEEEDFLIRPDDYVDRLGIPLSEKQIWPWSDLREGRVFLSGRFEASGDQPKPERFRITRGPERFMRIDGAIKEQVKRLYFKALKTERRS
jgi:hypothetical protein